MANIARSDLGRTARPRDRLLLMHLIPIWSRVGTQVPAALALQPGAARIVLNLELYFFQHSTPGAIIRDITVGRHMLGSV